MKGLTLIELMITVALLTIVLTTAVPGFSYLIERHQSNTAISSLKRILTLARTLALERKLSITTCPTINNQCTNDWATPITVFSDLNNNKTVDQGEPLYFSTEMDISTGYWQKKRVTSPFIKFNPLGHAFSSATTFLYCPYSDRLNLAKQLVIHFQGRIRISHYLSRNGTPYSNIAPLSCNLE